MRRDLEDESCGVSREWRITGGDVMLDCLSPGTQARLCTVTPAHSRADIESSKKLTSGVVLRHEITAQLNRRAFLQI